MSGRGSAGALLRALCAVRAPAATLHVAEAVTRVIFFMLRRVRRGKYHHVLNHTHTTHRDSAETVSVSDPDRESEEFKMCLRVSIEPRARLRGRVCVP